MTILITPHTNHVLFLNVNDCKVVAVCALPFPYVYIYLYVNI